MKTVADLRTPAGLVFDPATIRDRIEERSIPEPNSGCWLWLLGQHPKGYGSFSIGHARKHTAHRVSYVAFIGDIPDGLQVCHRCDNPPCVNPEHLFAGTPKQNTRDMIAKDRGNRGERNGGAKLLPHEVLDIISLGECGLSDREINDRYRQVTESAIYQITAGVRWKHLRERRTA